MSLGLSACVTAVSQLSSQVTAAKTALTFFVFGAGQNLEETFSWNYTLFSVAYKSTHWWERFSQFRRATYPHFPTSHVTRYHGVCHRVASVMVFIFDVSQRNPCETVKQKSQSIVESPWLISLEGSSETSSFTRLEDSTNLCVAVKNLAKQSCPQYKVLVRLTKQTWVFVWVLP